MAKGVKKIKKLSNNFEFDDYYNSGNIVCINPNQEALFAVGEWYDETTEEERRRNITWLWMDHKKIEKFNTTIKSAGVPYGVTLPKKQCGIYAFYLEVSLNGEHDPRNTGIYVFGKCEKNITSSSWSKKQNSTDNSEINYGNDLFITLEGEGINGNTLTLELYSEKQTDEEPIAKEKKNCVSGTIKAKFKTASWYRKFPGLPRVVENFYIKVIDIKGDYIKNANGNDKVLSFSIIYNKSIITIPVFEIPTNTAPSTIDDTPVIEEVKTEGIITAYFAKEEFTKETTEVDGQHEYKFANPNIKYDKNKIAGIIKSKVDVLVKADKKYAKLDDIKNALVEESYAKDTSITFNLCKLGAEYKKINNAPLEEEVYVVAKTFLLDGKEVSIKIKEKEAVLGEADADLKVLESKEGGIDITELKAVVENGIAKVKIKLRPKADEDLKKWKEKLLKGKKEEVYSYKFKNITTITDDNKKLFAAIILKNAKEGKQGNTKIATGKTAFEDDIEKALTSKTYDAGNEISFATYKTQEESLWLKAECQGDTKKYEGEFLKRDGQYFVIGKKCECEARVRAFMRTIRVAEGSGEYFKGTKQARDPQLGYTTWFSGAGNNFTLSDDHPRTINHNSTETVYSSAAGAYQIMSWKYDELNGYEIEEHNETFRTVVPKVYTEKYDLAKKYNAKGFSQVSQDKLCVAILKTLKITDLLLKNDIKGAISKSKETWVSLPGSTAGQPTAKMQETLDYYYEFLKEEIEGRSHLHIKSGFLKEFNLKCTCGNQSSSSWHHPLDRMELRGWYTETQFTPGKSDFHGRSGGAHDGLDLYATVGTTVYACIDGEITYREDKGGYGHRIFLEGDYNGQKYFLMYCHLSEYITGTVKAGDPIGETGQTGNASGQAAKMDHLHFEVRKVKMNKPSFDPLNEISELGRDVNTNPDKNTQTGE